MKDEYLEMILWEMGNARRHRTDCQFSSQRRSFVHHGQTTCANGACTCNLRSHIPNPPVHENGRTSFLIRPLQFHSDYRDRRSVSDKGLGRWEVGTATSGHLESTAATGRQTR